VFSRDRVLESLAPVSVEKSDFYYNSESEMEVVTAVDPSYDEGGGGTDKLIVLFNGVTVPCFNDVSFSKLPDSNRNLR